MKSEFLYVVKEVDKLEYGVKYIVWYLDFPGITGGGDTLEEALSIAKTGLKMYLDTLRAAGKEIPTPSKSFFKK